jgi:Na+-driven multidrug efflux pump
VSFAVSTAMMWPVCLALFYFRVSIVRLFTEDAEVTAMAAEFIAFTSVILAFYGLYFVSFRTLQASGDMISPMVISLGTAVLLGAPTGFFLATHGDLGARGMWIANLVYATANTLLMTVWLLTGRWARPFQSAASAGTVSA